MQKSTTMQARGSRIFKRRQLTIGLDLGDRSSFYCVLDDEGEVIVEHSLPTTPQAMKQVVAPKLVAYLMAVDRGQRNFQVVETNNCIAA